MTGTRWRLELRGRPGWFTPAAEAIFPASATAAEVTPRLLYMIHFYHTVEATDEVMVFPVSPATEAPQAPAQPAPKGSRAKRPRS